jgi:hypothetical protein
MTLFGSLARIECHPWSLKVAALALILVYAGGP